MNVCWLVLGGSGGWNKGGLAYGEVEGEGNQEEREGGGETFETGMQSAELAFWAKETICTDTCRTGEFLKYLRRVSITKGE